ncbi:hypothetical protein EV714DRAFT_222168 [Schizophyllum commune]
MDDPQNPPASSSSKTFGIHKYNPDYCLGSGAQREDRRRGYEDKYEDDALGEELGDDARIWRVMLDEGRANDGAMLQRFRDHLDVDLVFAGLFSAVLTTFVAQTSQTPSDTGDTTIALLLEIIAIQRAWADNPRVNDVASFSLPPPSPSPSPWINRCWFLSLIFSLLAAFGAVVVRQWLQEYESDITGPPKRRALVRHYRRVGLENYKVHLIVPILPMLLHVSLLLFFIGLTLYVRQSDRSMSNGIIALTAMIYLVYLGTNLMPVFRPQCPYRSPLSTGAHWAKSLVALSYALLPAKLRTKALLPFFLRNLQAAASHVHALLIGIQALGDSWKECFMAPDAHEWKAVLNSSDTMIPDSLDSMAQASTDLTVTPLVVQASSGLPIDHSHYDYNFENPRYKELLQRRILPWYINALHTRSMLFDWAPGRENELQRMACIFLLVPLNSWCYSVLWDEIDTIQYCTCLSRVLQSLKSALLDLSSTARTTTTDVATLSMTLLALGNRLDHLDFSLKLLQDGTLFDTITTAYSSLPEPPSLAVLRLRPVIWHQALSYLCHCGRSMGNTAYLAIALWRSAHSEVPFSYRDDRRKEHLATLPCLNLQEWLYLHPDFSQKVTIALYRLLCSQSCESHEDVRFNTKLSDASRLHMTCHAIDSYVKRDNAGGTASFDDNLGFLAVQFVGVLVTTLGYGSIESALRRIEHSKVSVMFKSTFLARPALLSTAKFWEADARLPATFAVSLFRLLVEAIAALTNHPDQQPAIRDSIRVLNRHASEYYDALLGEVSIEHLWPVVEALLRDPALAVLDIADILAAFLTTVLKQATSESNPRTRSSMSADDAVLGSVPSDQPADDMVWCLYLDSLCVARAHTAQISRKFPDASHKLRSSLLSLDSKYHETWKSELTLRLKQQWIPLVAALALKSTQGCKALAEWVDDLPTVVQDPNSGLKVRVPVEARYGDVLNWYRLFTSDPDKHIGLFCMERRESIPISELVSFEEAVERMQKIDAERAAAEGQRGTRGDGAESSVDGSDSERVELENEGSAEDDGLDDQGGAEHTQDQSVANRLRALGAWAAHPFISARPFLARIIRHRRGPAPAIVLSDIKVDAGRVAGSSVAPNTERRSDDPRIPAETLEGGLDGEREQAEQHQHWGGEQVRTDQTDEEDRDRIQAEEQPHVQRAHAPNRADEASALENAEQGGRTSDREIPEAGDGDEKRRDDEKGPGDEQELDNEQSRVGERGRDGEQSQVGERGPDDERSLDTKEGGQAEEVPHPPRRPTQDTEDEASAREAVEHEGDH